MLDLRFQTAKLLNTYFKSTLQNEFGSRFIDILKELEEEEKIGVVHWYALCEKLYFINF